MQKCLICGKKAKYFIKELSLFPTSGNKFFLCGECIDIKWSKKGPENDI